MVLFLFSLSSATVSMLNQPRYIVSVYICAIMLLLYSWS